MSSPSWMMPILGLVFRDGIYQESIFTLLADAHPGVLAVKIDGATKEDCVWGYRVGFLTYGFKVDGLGIGRVGRQDCRPSAEYHFQCISPCAILIAQDP